MTAGFTSRRKCHQHRFGCIAGSPASAGQDHMRSVATTLCRACGFTGSQLGRPLFPHGEQPVENLAPARGQPGHSAAPARLLSGWGLRASFDAGLLCECSELSAGAGFRNLLDSGSSSGPVRMFFVELVIRARQKSCSSTRDRSRIVSGNTVLRTRRTRGARWT